MCSLIEKVKYNRKDGLLDTTKCTSENTLFSVYLTFLLRGNGQIVQETVRCFTEHMVDQQKHRRGVIREGPLAPNLEPKTHAISRDSSEGRGLASGTVLGVEGLQLRQVTSMKCASLRSAPLQMHGAH